MKTINLTYVNGSFNINMFSSVLGLTQNGRTPIQGNQDTGQEALGFYYASKGILEWAIFPSFNNFILPPNYYSFSRSVGFVYNGNPYYFLNYNTFSYGSVAIYKDQNTFLFSSNVQVSTFPNISFKTEKDWFFYDDAISQYIKLTNLEYITPISAFPFYQNIVCGSDFEFLYVTSPGYNIYKYYYGDLSFSLNEIMINPVPGFICGTNFGVYLLLYDNNVLYNVVFNNIVDEYVFNGIPTDQTVAALFFDDYNYFYVKTFDSSGTPYLYVSSYFIPIYPSSLSDPFGQVKNFTPNGSRRYAWPHTPKIIRR